MEGDWRFLFRGLSMAFLLFWGMFWLEVGRKVFWEIKGGGGEGRGRLEVFRFSFC